MEVLNHRFTSIATSALRVSHPTVATLTSLLHSVTQFRLHYFLHEHFFVEVCPSHLCLERLVHIRLNLSAVLFILMNISASFWVISSHPVTLSMCVYTS